MKLLLNESQCFMLQNREKHVIIDKDIIGEKEKNLEEMRIENQKNNLTEYLKKIKMQERSFSKIDILLINYLSKDFKKELGNIVQN